MARAIDRLSAVFVKTCAAPGRYADGSGLYLAIDDEGRRRWLYLYTVNGKRREMGLGSAREVSLKAARAARDDARSKLRAGTDPLSERRAMKARPAFGDFALDYIKAQAPGWKNAKHLAQWCMTLSCERDDRGELMDTGYCLSLRKRPVDTIDTEDVLRILRPIWAEKPETASRLRGRIEAVLDAAKAKGLRDGENPARWRGHLDKLLPKASKLSRGHHAAMPYGEVPAFVQMLRKASGTTALALEFAILTAARSGEVRGARWSEIDLDNALWTIPAGRMKTSREHVVPLPERALEMLAATALLRDGQADNDALVFPSMMKGAQLSDAAFSALMNRQGAGDYTAHGFRSSFRDWAGDRTTFEREVAEAALAHAVGDATERAYRRGSALDKRRKLMDAWAAHVNADAAGKVIAAAFG